MGSSLDWWWQAVRSLKSCQGDHFWNHPYNFFLVEGDLGTLYWFCKYTLFGVVKQVSAYQLNEETLFSWGGLRQVMRGMTMKSVFHVARLMQVEALHSIFAADRVKVPLCQSDMSLLGQQHDAMT